MSMPVPVSEYRDYLNYTENMNCKIHSRQKINPLYGKCFLCRVADGDFKICESCVEKKPHNSMLWNYYDPKKYGLCYECAMSKEVKKND